MNYFVYILLSDNYKKTYTGISSNLERRLQQHNGGKDIFTNRYRPWKLFYKEQYNTRLEARKREKYLKSAAGRKWMKKLFSSQEK